MKSSNILWIGLLSLNMVFAQDKNAKPDPKIIQQVEQLKREIIAIEALKREKADQLESKEAARWDARYKQNLESKLWEDKARSLEGKYSTLAGDISRKQEEVSKEESKTSEVKAEAEAMASSQSGFDTQLKLAIEKSSTELSQDLPVNIAERTVTLGKASQSLTGPDAQTEKAIGLYLGDRLWRLELSLTQSVESRKALFEGNIEADAYRLRAGTVFLADIAKSGTQIQVLLKTGALQGQTYAWRSDLTPLYAEQVKTAVLKASAAQNGILALSLPVDVLQSKGNGFTQKVEKSWIAKFKEWFHEGGLVMWPLTVILLITWLMIIQKALLLWRRKSQFKRLSDEVLVLIRNDKIDQAIAFCKGIGSKTALTLADILDQRTHLNRASAEKAVQTALMKEIPQLEKRMTMIQALGSVAPMLGLLGTVSGMITLFATLNEVGTNDAKLLAGGISEALVATEMGLLVAIPVMIIHGMLSERLEGVIQRIQTLFMESLNQIWPENNA